MYLLDVGGHDTMTHSTPMGRSCICLCLELTMDKVIAAPDLERRVGRIEAFLEGKDFRVHLSMCMTPVPTSPRDP